MEGASSRIVRFASIVAVAAFIACLIGFAVVAYPSATEEPSVAGLPSSFVLKGGSLVPIVIFDKDGFDATGRDRQGFDRHGYDPNGLDRQGFDQNGYDRHGYDRLGFNRTGYPRNKLHYDLIRQHFADVVRRHFVEIESRAAAQKGHPHHRKTATPEVDQKTIIDIDETDSLSSIFSLIYNRSDWKNGSGPGSDPANAIPYLSILQKLFNHSKIHSIVDMGNGDWQLMRKIKIPSDKVYDGYGVVKNVQFANRRRFGRPNVRFHVVRSVLNMQNVSADLLVIKDVIQHWTNAYINYFYRWILPRFKYALITNSVGSVIVGVNNDIPSGQFRNVRLLLPPYNWKNVYRILEYDIPSDRDKKEILFFKNPALTEEESRIDL